MINNGIVVVVAISVLWSSINGDTCTNCTTTYTTTRDTAPNDDVKCTALQTYLACLDNASGTGCPISGTQSTTIGTDYNNISLTCFLSEPCLCQKDYWSNIQDNCNAAKTLISCLRATTGLSVGSKVACNGITTVPSIASSAVTIISNLGSCSIPARSGCKCEVDYATSVVSPNENLCKHTKIFISCIKGLDEKMCDGKIPVATAAQTANSVIAAVGSICTIPALSTCKCEIDYARSNISSNDKKCSEVKRYIGCLKGRTEKDCAGETPVVDLAAAAEATVAALPSCTVDNTSCGCELAYAKANISSSPQKCTELKKYISCLKGKNGSACDGIKSVPDLVTEAESAASNLPSCDTAGTTCGCEVAFAKTDTSTSAVLCIETKKLISCLKTKIDIACDNTTTVIELATAAEATINGISSCNLNNTPCACETAYAKANIGNDTMLCTETKRYGGCLKKLTGTGCDGSTTVASLVTTAESTMSGIPKLGCNNTGACACEFSYAKADISNDTKKCAETKKYVSCLKSKTGTGCDMVTNVSELATEAEGTIVNISKDVCPLQGTPCECEIKYAKADIKNDMLLCSETKRYVSCLKTRTGRGCDGTTSVAGLVEAAETTLSGIVDFPCFYKDNACGCEIAYAKSDISDNFKKCIQTKAYLSCLKDKIGFGCDGYRLTPFLALDAENTIKSMPDGECPLFSTVCSCDVEYAKTMINDSSTQCIALLNYMSCLLGKAGSGCNGISTLRTLANNTEKRIASLGSIICPKTNVCECEIAYAKSDVSSSMKMCKEAKTLTACVQTSLDKGCGASVTRSHVGNFTQKVFDTLGARLCPLSDTCVCQVNYNKADVGDSTKCSAAVNYETCLEAVNKTSQTGCDDITLNKELFNKSSKATTEICATGTRTDCNFLIVSLLLSVVMIFLSNMEE